MTPDETVFEQADASHFDTTTVAQLDPLLAELGIDRWDAVIVGDGSATTWEHGCGWAATLVDRATAGQRHFYGGMSAGTNHTGELWAYLGPMLWYSQNLGKQHLDARMRTPTLPPCLLVHIITDSENVANQGNKLQRRRANRALWAAMDSFVGDGFALIWHWCERSKLALNRWADEQSRQMRVMLERIGEGMNGIELPLSPFEALAAKVKKK